MPLRAELSAQRVCVISPHLDDAVLSAWGVLSDTAIPLREAVTVVTQGTPGRITPWSTLTGFADAAAEHDARREEDRRALGELGAVPLHLGAMAEDPRSLREAVRRFVASRIDELRNTLVLVPAAAGRQHSLMERLRRRLLRRPDPLAPHPDHLQVRDACERELQAAGLESWGYYADLPYLRFETLQALQQRLGRRRGRELRSVQIMPAGSDKLRVAGMYASQLKPALGDTPEARQAFCDWPEYVFIPR